MLKITNRTMYIIVSCMISIILLTGCKSNTELMLSGTVESNEIDVTSEAAGKVISFTKEEGMAVKKGDVIAKVDDELQKLVVQQYEAMALMKSLQYDESSKGSRKEQIDQAKAGVHVAKSNYDNVKSGTRSEQIRQAEAEVQMAKTALEIDKLNYNRTLEKYNDMKKLYDEKKISEEELKDAKLKLDTIRKSKNISNEKVRAASEQLNLLKKGATSSTVGVAKGEYERALAQLALVENGPTKNSLEILKQDYLQVASALQQQKLLLQKYQIISPIDGVFTSKNVEIGDIVNKGSSIGVISDVKDLTVTVYIPQKYLNLISLNQNVKLLFSSLDQTDVKGKITYISSEAEFTPKNTETKEAKENTVFKVKIKVLDHLEKIKPGMTVDVMIPMGAK